MAPRRRGKNDSGDISSLYDPEDKCFTLEVYHGGKFKNVKDRVVYDGGRVDYFDYCNSLKMRWRDIDGLLVKHLKLSGFCNYYFRIPEKDFKDGLKQVKNGKEVNEMREWALEFKRLELYIVQLTEYDAKEQLQEEIEKEYDELHPIPKSSVVIEEIEEPPREPKKQGLLKKKKKPGALYGRLLLEWKPSEIEGSAGVSGVPGSKSPSLQSNVESRGDENVYTGLEDLRDVGGVNEENNRGSENANSGGRGRVAEPETGGEEQDESEGSDFICSEYDLSDDDAEFEEYVDDILESEAMQFDFGRGDPSVGPILDEEAPNRAEEDETDYDDDENCLRSLGSDDEGEELGGQEEVTRQFVEYNREIHLDNPIMVEGMVFANASEFRELMKAYALKEKKPLYLHKSEPWRLQVRCRKENCRFRVWVSKVQGKNQLMIKTIVMHHRCGVAVKNKNLTAEWLAHHYVDKIRRHPDIAVETFIQDIRAELQVQPSYYMAYRAIRKAADLIYGTEIEQFSRLRDYAEEMLRVMPGSTVILQCDESIFQRIYICLAPLKEGFKAGVRKFVGLDGCFLKTAYKGQLLAAVGIDGNNGMYPIAWAVVEVENTSSWTWFIRLLKEDLRLEDDQQLWTLITDQQKGLDNAIRTELPGVEHRFCIRHLHSNWKKKYPGKSYKDAMYAAGKATTFANFSMHMEKIKIMSREAYEELSKYDKAWWSRCAFREESKVDALVNNWCEAFNRSILRARNKPIITLLNSINTIVMTRIQRKRDAMRGYDGVICPRISKILKKRDEGVGSYSVVWNGGARYQVSTRIDQYVVDVVEKTCTCRSWQLSGLPCLHAFAVIHERGDNYEDYVHACYMKATFLRVYGYLLEPVCGPSLWKRSEYPPVKPPLLRKLPGRPKKCRKRDLTEDKEKEERAAAEATKQASLDANGVKRVGRKGSKMHCSYKGCGSENHNRRTCPIRLAEVAASEGATAAADGAPAQQESEGQERSRDTQEQTVLQAEGGSSSQPPVGIQQGHQRTLRKRPRRS